MHTLRLHSPRPHLHRAPPCSTTWSPLASHAHTCLLPGETKVAGPAVLGSPSLITQGVHVDPPISEEYSLVAEDLQDRKEEGTWNPRAPRVEREGTKHCGRNVQGTALFLLKANWGLCFGT